MEQGTTHRQHLPEQFANGISALKNEWKLLTRKAESCFDFFTLPVNNFLKDLDHMEREFRRCSPAEEKAPMLQVVSISEAMMRDMGEENY